MNEITHAAIKARRTAAFREAENAWDKASAEIRSLVELCAGMGHQFGPATKAHQFRCDPPSESEGTQHSCTCCGFKEWVERRDYVSTAKQADVLDITSLAATAKTLTDGTTFQTRATVGIADERTRKQIELAIGRLYRRGSVK